MKHIKNVIKTSQSDTHRVTSLGRPEDNKLIIIHKIGFWANFSIFLDAKCILDSAEPKYILFWSYCGPVSLYHKETIRGCPRDVVCLLGYYIVTL